RAPHDEQWSLGTMVAPGPRPRTADRVFRRLPVLRNIHGDRLLHGGGPAGAVYRIYSRASLFADAADHGGARAGLRSPDALSAQRYFHQDEANSALPAL